MKIFDLICDLDRFASFLFADEHESAKWGKGWFDGAPRGNSYPIPRAVRNREGDGPRSEVLPDFTQIGLRPIPTFSAHAIHCIGGMLAENGELASIRMDEGFEYFAFNATNVVDVLDESNSELSLFRDGRVMSVDRHVFLMPASRLPIIFKIPQTRENTTYVTEDFVSLVGGNGLTGFEFKIVFEA